MDEDTIIMETVWFVSIHKCYDKLKKINKQEKFYAREVEIRQMTPTQSDHKF